MKVALTGGIACGKSLLSKFLNELGVETLDADDVVHTLLPDPEERRRIAAEVFADPEKRKELEARLHPIVKERIDTWLSLSPSGSGAQPQFSKPAPSAPLGTRSARLGRDPTGCDHPQGAVTRLCVKNNHTTQPPNYLTISGCTEHNLKNITARFPVGAFTVVTGVSGSGKSTLVDETLKRALLQKFYHAKAVPGKFKKLTGFENFDKIVEIDQSPIGRTPRSNPATYVGFFSEIRELFAKTESARARLHCGALLLQCEGRKVRDVRRRWPPEARDELPPRCLRHMRPVRRQALQRRDS